MRANRPQIYQRLFFGEPLRSGTFRIAYVEHDGYDRCCLANAFAWIDDRTFLCAHRYDIRTYTYARHSGNGRSDEDHAFPFGLLRDSRSGIIGSSRFERFRGRDDCLRWLFPVHRVFTIVACTSIVITAVYILRVVGKLLYGKVQNEHHRELTDAVWYERLSAITLIVGVAAIGMAPGWISNLISDSMSVISERILQYI